ncbi:hypothetical protein EGT46_00755 [Yersinia pestis]|uniref:hypothetical protein n=1 Tax=Yersinia pestis TaxID=632 RepID=UPI0005B1E5BB|nr:hypothetical protein [Yersinia pestis]ROZ98613.1 hypothetical protein EGT46_00755 [Yersinia pestis]
MLNFFLEKYTTKQIIAGCIYIIIGWSVVLFGWFDSIKFIDFLKYLSVIAIPAIIWTTIIVTIKNMMK